MRYIDSEIFADIQTYDIDDKDSCSIDVIDVDKNKQKVKDNYKFEFKIVKKGLLDMIGGEFEVSYNNEGEIREKESSIGTYGSENNYKVHRYVSIHRQIKQKIHIRTTEIR